MILLSDIHVSLRTARGKRMETVLDDVSLQIDQGQFVSIVGASGCGKSTLLNVIAGLDEPTSGSVRVAGEVALMAQDPALFAWLTARENVALALHDKGMSRDEERAESERLLCIVGLARDGDKRPHELSGGMRQRVAIARALARGSRVLLMDEPFSALDTVTREGLHHELINLWKENALTVVFVTHNVHEAVSLGQRVVLMAARPGRIVRQWIIDESYPRDPSSAVIRDLETEITVALKGLEPNVSMREGTAPKENAFRVPSATERARDVLV